LQYATIAGAYEKIEATTKRLEMTDLLVNLLKSTPKEVVDTFERIAKPMDDTIESNDRQTKYLSVIRDALLPKLLSGEIRVKVK